MNAPVDVGRFGSGHAVRRIEDEALLTGQGRYTDDVVPAGQTVMVFLRSPYAHARIVSVDTAAARAIPGVVAVITGEDLVKAGVHPLPYEVPFPRPDGSPAASPIRRALAHERVRYVGEAVAAIVAEDRFAALDAADAILIDYEELPSVVDVEGALAGKAVLCEQAPDNITAAMQHGDAAKTAEAFAKAAQVVAVDIVNQRLAPSPIEPRSVLAQVDAATQRLEIRISNQMPTAVRDAVAGLLGLPPDKVRVVVGDVGGGFGMKTGPYPEDIVAAYAAWTLKRPVKWVAQRLEEFSAAGHGRDQTSHAEMALDAHGKVLAMRVRTVANVGAYGTTVGVLIPLLIGPWVTTSIYDIQTIDLKLIAVLTNTMTVGAYRGAGRPEAIYITERLMDAAARGLRMDPAELRRRNMIRPDQFPYTNPMQQVYDCGQFEKMLDQALALSDWNGFAARRAESKARGRLRGRGIASFLEWTGGNVLTEQATVSVSADGYIDVISATQAMGQGIATSYAQLAVDVFGVPIEKIRVLQGDTDRANGFGSAGSRSLFTGGGAVHVASEQTVVKARQLAGEALEVAAADVEYRAGRFSVVGTDKGIGLFELAAKQPGTRIVVEATATAGAPSWPNACHVCEVEIDPDTGKVEVVEYTSVNDIGRVVSPEIVRGQVEGGAVQGIGQALSERVVYERDSGQLLSASFMDYTMPHLDLFRPNFKTVFDTSVPCLTNTLGVKGVGELGTIGATPAVVNAVVDALDAAGLGADAERVQMPLTAATVWRALQRDFDPAAKLPA